jgi:hypothetical protein
MTVPQRAKPASRADAGLIEAEGAPADLLAKFEQALSEHRHLAPADSGDGGWTPDRCQDRRPQRGGSVPPSASVLMFWMARVNVAVRDALSLSRAASSGSIELS